MNESYPPCAEGLLAVLRRLRAPDGCPWDRKQTRASLTRHLSGECGELLEAIDQQDPPHICEELGDVLMNLLFQVVIAEENGEFSWQDVCRGIVEKMIRRHAHIFGSAHAETPEEVEKLWAQVKAREKGAADEKKNSVLDGIPYTLSALERAEKIQKKAAETGFDWSDAQGVLEKIREETGEVAEALSVGREEAIEEELGDLLFAAVNLIRFRKGKSAEELLRAANRKFERRFRRMELMLAAGNGSWESTSAADRERLWKEVKEEENK